MKWQQKTIQQTQKAFLEGPKWRPKPLNITLTIKSNGIFLSNELIFVNVCVVVNWYTLVR